MGVSAWPLFVYYQTLPSLLRVLTFFFFFSFNFKSIGLYIIAFDRDKGHLNDLVKVLFVKPFYDPVAAGEHDISCMQLTDRRVYFTWDDARHRMDIPLFEDEQIGQLDLLSPNALSSTVSHMDLVRLDREFRRCHHTDTRFCGILTTN